MSVNISNVEVISAENKKISLGNYKGNVLLIVNVASKCGFTKQYADLQILWDKYKSSGLIVIGIPSNSFNQ